MRICSTEGCYRFVFSTDKITRKGYCKSCAMRYRTDISRKTIMQRAIEKQRGIENKIRGLKALPDNVDMVVKLKNGRDIELENYFRLAEMELDSCPYCQECHSRISKEYFHHSVAHIFPKARFFSVRANYNNRLFLCTQNGCHEMSHRLDTFSQMDIFPEAVRKYELFKDEIKEKHKYKNLFEEYVNELNTTI